MINKQKGFSLTELMVVVSVMGSWDWFPYLI